MFLPSETDKNFPAQVRVMQIIVGGLIMGVLMFAGVASFIAFNQDQPQVKVGAKQAGKVPQGLDANNQNAAPDAPIRGNEMPVVAYLAAGMAGMMIILRFIIPGILARNAIQQLSKEKSTTPITKEQLVPTYQISLIVASALLEGAALFNLIALIIHHQVWSLGIAGVLVVLMAAGMPTIDRVNSWTEEQLRNLQ